MIELPDHSSNSDSHNNFLMVAKAQFKRLAIAAGFSLLLAGCGKDATTGQQDKPAQPGDLSSLPIRDPSDSVATPAPKPDENPEAPQVASEPATVTASNDSIELAERYFQSGDAAKADAIVTRLMIRSPDNSRVRFLAANLAAGRGELDVAVDLLQQIKPNDPVYLPSLGQSSDWLMKLGRLDEAETRYLSILKAVPSFAVARRRLADLYNRQGRRQEAADQIVALCASGSVMEDELYALISIPDAYFDGEAGGEEDTATVIGVGGTARVQFTNGDFDAAEQTLREASKKNPLKPAELAFMGRVLAENQSFEALPGWLGQTNDATKAFGNYWFALGVWMLWEDQVDNAITAFREALIRVPTDQVGYKRVADCFRRKGDADSADWCLGRAKLLFATQQMSFQIGAVETPEANLILLLADRLDELERPFEAIAWRAIATAYAGSPKEVLINLNQKRLALLQERRTASAEPGSSPTTSRNPNVLPPALREDNATDLGWASELPRTLDAQSAAESIQLARGIPSFVDVTKNVGIAGTYCNGVEQVHRIYMIHHTTGGGVAVLDYDLDGRADLYFPQGAAAPNLSDLNVWNGEKSNLFFRHTPKGFELVTSPSGSDNLGYGQGVTAGDFNGDGFPDLAIANIGFNVLMINRGDGTFEDVSDRLDEGRGRWTTNLAIADLNGDALPELIESNYIDDPVVYQDRLAAMNLPPGAPIPDALVPQPADYDASVDRVFVNLGNMKTNRVELEVPEGAENCNAMAVLVTDIDGQGGNDIFVANDMRTNQLWLNEEASDPDRLPLREAGVVAGCAYSNRGEANACMGIAPADFDGNGLIDFMVTNFYREPFNFFVQKAPGRFVDLAAKSDLSTIGYNVNSFGTQPLDYDNNGRIDLVVLNGHIHDARHRGEPFRMMPQLIDGTDDEFVAVDMSDSEYWATPSLGRAVAKLDYNHDGLVDLVTTHLDLPHTLLENQSEAVGDSVQIQLIGTESERDAIGALVVVESGSVRHTMPVTTGDGFETKNESVLMFGLGKTSAGVDVSIKWPSGREQQFNQLVPNARYTVTEGDPQIALQFDY